MPLVYLLPDLDPAGCDVERTSLALTSLALPAPEVVVQALGRAPVVGGSWIATPDYLQCAVGPDGVLRVRQSACHPPVEPVPDEGACRDTAGGVVVVFRLGELPDHPWPDTWPPGPSGAGPADGRRLGTLAEPPSGFPRVAGHEYWQAGAVAVADGRYHPRRPPGTGEVRCVVWDGTLWLDRWGAPGATLPLEVDCVAGGAVFAPVILPAG